MEQDDANELVLSQPATQTVVGQDVQPNPQQLVQPDYQLNGITELANTFANNYKGVFLYNAAGGNATIPSNFEGNFAIYNAGNVQFQSTIFCCNFCNMQFANQASLTQHNRREFKHCYEHGMCFNSWTNHNKWYTHTICGLDWCWDRGVEFGSNDEYLAHFQKEHCIHYEALNDPRSGRKRSKKSRRSISIAFESEETM